MCIYVCMYVCTTNFLLIQSTVSSDIMFSHLPWFPSPFSFRDSAGKSSHIESTRIAIKAEFQLSRNKGVSTGILVDNTRNNELFSLHFLKTMLSQGLILLYYVPAIQPIVLCFTKSGSFKWIRVLDLPGDLAKFTFRCLGFPVNDKLFLFFDE